MIKKYLPTLLIGSCMSFSVLAHEHKHKHEHEDEDEYEYQQDWDLVLAATGGISFVNTQLSGSVPFEPSSYHYSSQDSGDANGLWGGFLGFETELDDWDAQLGVGYYWTRADANGTVVQGSLPDEFNSSYKVTSQQIIAEGKILWEATEIIRPYLTGGLGVSINDTHDFQVDLDDPLSMSPEFNKHTETSFSWMVGAGIDAQLAESVRLGLAYRFTDFGKYGLGDCALQDGTPLEGSLSSSNLYASEIVAQLSYLFDL